MKRNLVAFLVTFVLVLGCAGWGDVYKSPDKMFYIALQEHTRLLKAYNDYYDTADAEVQQIMREDVDPKLMRMDDAFKAWHYARTLGSEPQKDMEYYLKLKNEVIRLLIEYKIVEVE